MKKITLMAISSLLIVFFSGCASSSLNYTPPKQLIKNEIVTNKIIYKDYEKAWNELINNLVDNSFIINNLDKESGFINVDYTLNDPINYVDCGEWQGYFKDLKYDEKYQFNGAESTNYITKYAYSIAKVKSNKNLSGKINILLQKLDDKKQNLKVNIKYVLQNKNVYNVLFPKKKKSINWKIEFDSKNKGYSKISKTQCQSKGVLEKEILNYIK